MKFTSPLLILLLVAFTSLHTDFVTQPPYKLIVKETTGGPATPQILVIKEPMALKRFYSKVNQTRRPGLAVPSVDFTKEFVLILCMGTMQTTGHEVSINKLENDKGKTLKILVEEKHPDKNLKLPKVFNEPFSVYVIQGNYKNIEFEKLNTTKEN